MTSRRRSIVVALVIVLVLATAGAGGLLYRQRADGLQDQKVQALAARLATAIGAKDVTQVPFAKGDAATEQRRLAAAVKGLGSATATVKASEPTRAGDTARSRLAVQWTLPGGAAWSYEVPVTFTRAAGAWQVTSGQRLVNPDLAPGEVLRLARTQPPRAAILGGDGKPIVSDRPVVDVGIQPSRVTGSVTALAAKVSSIVPVDAAPLANRVSAASKDAFVDVITLRRSDYDAVKAKLQPLPGVVFRQRQQALAPSREFARALLGSVGPVTPAIVQQGNGRYAPGDIAGVSGLQRQYDEQLAGTAGTTVRAVPASGGAGRNLFEVAPKAGTALPLTLDAKIQVAADAALVGLKQPAALVAVDVKTGAVLAIANSPATGLNRAMVGRYPPGSTFKVVTTLALLQKGLKPTDSVNCPPTAVVDGRSFKNFEDEQFGAVPFRTDFAKSCNTAFVGLSKRLADDDLKNTAARLGIGAKWDLGVAAFSGSVPTTTTAVDKAAASFGQARDEVSPLAIAVATASVARGSYVPPSLVLRKGSIAAQGTALPAGPIATLRSLMRSVVTDGTGSALKSVAGTPVRAKTGTAEFGTGSQLRTRAWITGWQDNIAFTAFVEEGKSGGTVAGPVAAKFLTLLRG